MALVPVALLAGLAAQHHHKPPGVAERQPILRDVLLTVPLVRLESFVTVFGLTILVPLVAGPEQLAVLLAKLLPLAGEEILRHNGYRFRQWLAALLLVALVFLALLWLTAFALRDEGAERVSGLLGLVLLCARVQERVVFVVVRPPLFDGQSAYEK